MSTELFQTSPEIEIMEERQSDWRPLGIWNLGTQSLKTSHCGHPY